VQTNVWGRYHITDVADFYTKNDAWDVAQDPDTASSKATVTTSSNTSTTQGQTTGSGKRRIDPYYLVTRLPGEKSEEFIILRPFVPQSSDDQGQLLTSFLVARSDGENYGQLQSYVMPRRNLPLGPALVAGSISGDVAVSQAETLLQGPGSTLLKGNLILVPIEESILYVRPYFVEATQTKIPKLERVVAAFGGKVTIKPTLAEALADLFGTAPPTLEDTTGTTGTTTPPATGSVTEQVARLLQDALTLRSDADKALAAGDLGTYQSKINQALQKVAEAAKLLSGQTGSGGTTTTTAPTTSTTAASA
jgi:uncharacterized membrane protein (UPF0182 family)